MEVAGEDGAPNFLLPGNWCDEVIDKQLVGRANSLVRCAWRTESATGLVGVQYPVLRARIDLIAEQGFGVPQTRSSTWDY